MAAYLGPPLATGALVATIALRDELARLYTRTPALARDWPGRHAGPMIVWLDPGTEFMVGRNSGEVLRRKDDVVFWTA